MNETGSGGFGFVFDLRALLIALSVIALLGLAAWFFFRWKSPARISPVESDLLRKEFVTTETFRELPA